MASKLQDLLNRLCPNGVEYRRLGDCVRIRNGSDYKQLQPGDIPVFGSGGLMTYVDRALYDKVSVLIPRKGSIDKLYYVDKPFWTVDTLFYTEIDLTVLVPKYLFYVLQKEHLEQYNTAGGVPSLTQGVLNKVLIPVPPLEVQSEIVQILDNFAELTAELTAELEKRKKQYEHYRRALLCGVESSELRVESSAWPMVKLGEIGRVAMCKRILKQETSTTGDIPFYKIGTFGKIADAYISKTKFEEYREKYSYPNKGDILISAAGTIGRAIAYDGAPAYYQDSNIVWLEHDQHKVLNRFLYYCYQLNPWHVSVGGTIPRLYNDNILKAEIPLPPLAEQRRIVSILDRFDRLCNDLTSGLPAEIAARKKQYAYYRDKLLELRVGS